MATRRTSLGFCLICTEPPYPDGDCDCAVDMKVCDICGRGPLNDSDPDVCGEPDCKPAKATPTVTEMGGMFKGGPDSVEWLREQRDCTCSTREVRDHELLHADDCPQAVPEPVEWLRCTDCGLRLPSPPMTAGPCPSCDNFRGRMVPDEAR